MNKPVLKFLLKLVISAALVYLVYTRVDFRQFYESLRHAKTGRLVVVLALTLLFLLPKIYKWYYLVRQIDGSVTFGDATLSYLSGLVLGVVTPARTGEIARVMYLDLDDRIKATGLVVVDRLYDIWVVLLFSILGSFVFLHYTVSILLIAGVICLITMLLFARRLAGLFARLIRFLPFKKKLGSLLDASTACTASANAVVLVSTLASYFVFCLQAYFFILCFEEISFMSVLKAYPMIALINVLPITIGGIGLRENAAILILGRFSISPGVAASVSFMLFFIDIVIPGIIGLLIWTFFKRKSAGRPHEAR
ncbi:MAG: flippase-like domain-containing protein [Candidatus Krumholzibacteriota bacterium]|nr:flippase-like domain-containing protein [Candidatus Krumholzibacteriota bacterium]